MKSLALGYLILSTAAISAENAGDPLSTDVISQAQLRAMQGRLDASISKTIAEAIKGEAVPSPYYQSATAFSSANSNIMTAAFIEAKVPDCLHSDGLKRQSTFFLGGVLALPFIAVAAVRGKCI